MLIRFKRHPDGSASLTCVRSDGTTTWQRQRGQIGLVFPPHDLTHYAVETALGFRNGFYGLIDDGWDISDFAKPWPKGEIPVEAQEVELIVGFFDTERRSFGEMTEEEFNDHATRYLAARKSLKPGALGSARRLSAEEIERVRARRSELLGEWGALRPGATLELVFDRPLPNDHAARGSGHGALRSG
jgi:hypothetical protein